MTNYNPRDGERRTDRGFFGRPVFVALVAILALLVLGWGATEYWGRSKAPGGVDLGTTSSTTTNPVPGKATTTDTNQPVKKIEPVPANPDTGKANPG